MSEQVAEGSAEVWHGPAAGFATTTFALPTDLAPGAVLAKIRMTTLCGSDVHTIAGDRSTPTPTVLGHEIVGEVVGTGGGVEALDGTHLQPGQRISWTLHAACGACRRCERGMSNKCHSLRKYGHEKATPEWSFNGGFAEYCQLLPGTGIVALPDSLPDRLAAPANCATATVVAATRRASVHAEDALVVQGCGMLGLTAIAYGRHLGMGTIVACDINPQRRALATSLGASCEASPELLGETVHNVTNAEGADLVLEVSGNTDAVQASLGLLGVGGRVALVGSVSPGPDVGLNPERVVRGLHTVVGSHNYLPEDLVEAVCFLEQTPDQAALAQLVPNTYSLAELRAAVAAARSESAPPRIAVCP